MVCQAMVNMGVVLGLGPITGQPLPLISMGRTSMVFTGLALGIVLSVSSGEQDDSWDKQQPKAEVKENNKNISTAQAASSAINLLVLLSVVAAPGAISFLLLPSRMRFVSDIRMRRSFLSALP